MRKAAVAAIVLAAGLAGFKAGTAFGAKNQKQALLQADRDFDEATSRQGSEAWASFFADDGIMMPAGADMAVGREAIRKLMAQTFSEPGYSLRWEPIDGAVSGDLGYTYGVFKSTRMQARRTATTYGKYVTIWKRQRGGLWKVAMDIGNQSPAPAK